MDDETSASSLVGSDGINAVAMGAANVADTSNIARQLGQAVTKQGIRHAHGRTTKNANLGSTITVFPLALASRICVHAMLTTRNRNASINVSGGACAVATRLCDHKTTAAKRCWQWLTRARVVWTWIASQRLVIAAYCHNGNLFQCSSSCRCAHGNRECAEWESMSQVQAKLEHAIAFSREQRRCGM